MQFVILRDVVHYNCFTQIAPNATQIFDVDTPAELATIAVEPIANGLELIEIVEDPVSVLFESGSEDDKLKVLGHFAKEGCCVRSSPVMTSAWVEVY